jgi:hypothetical protein
MRIAADVKGGKLSTEKRIFYQNYLAMRNAAVVTGVKPITVRSQSISGVSAVYALVVFYDIHVRKGEMQFFCSVLNTETYAIFEFAFFIEW